MTTTTFTMDLSLQYNHDFGIIYFLESEKENCNQNSKASTLYASQGTFYMPYSTNQNH